MLYFDFPRKWFSVTGMPGVYKFIFNHMLNYKRDEFFFPFAIVAWSLPIGLSTYQLLGRCLIVYFKIRMNGAREMNSLMLPHVKKIKKIIVYFIDA